MADGPAAGLRELDALEKQEPAAREIYLAPAARADMLRRMGSADAARAEYRRAAGMAPSKAERRFLEGRAGV
jgi:RNA polymerase sigma-70 factor (ECF subfamily)